MSNMEEKKHQAARIVHDENDIDSEFENDPRIQHVKDVDFYYSMARGVLQAHGFQRVTANNIAELTNLMLLREHHKAIEASARHSSRGIHELGTAAAFGKIG